MPRRIVVVGNGIAGLTAGDALRASGFDGELTIVGDEHHAPYSRPALSKAALLDGAEMTSHLLPAASHEAVELLGTTATGLDVDRRLVHLGEGDALPYDALVIASGSRARRLSTAPLAGESTLRGLDDATALRRRLAGSPWVVVIGGGALAMEIASGCVASGCRVTLVSRRDPLTALLGPALSALFVAAARDAGVTMRRSATVALHEEEGRTVVTLDDREQLRPDLVVSAIGDVPNTEWLSTSGLLTEGELRTDACGRVRPGIVAAGDVAAFPTPRGVRRVALWTSAIERAKVAAASLVHGDTAPSAFQPYFWTDQFGLSLKACGHLPVAGAPTVVDGDPASGRALMTWVHADDGSGTAAALNYRIPVPRLRALSRAASTDAD